MKTNLIIKFIFFTLIQILYLSIARCNDMKPVFKVEEINSFKSKGNHYNLESKSDHIKKDMKDVFGDFANYLQYDGYEKDFHYFNVHDYDGNSLLDGLELLSAMQHANEDEKNDLNNYNVDHSFKTQKVWNDHFETDSRFIDKLLADLDKNQDGYLSFSEFRAKKKDE